MGKSAISAAVADAGIEQGAITALYAGNMLSGMLSDQQVTSEECRTLLLGLHLDD